MSLGPQEQKKKSLTPVKIKGEPLVASEQRCLEGSDALGSFIWKQRPREWRGEDMDIKVVEQGPQSGWWQLAG